MALLSLRECLNLRLLLAFLPAMPTAGTLGEARWAAATAVTALLCSPGAPPRGKGGRERRGGLPRLPPARLHTLPGRGSGRGGDGPRRGALQRAAQALAEGRSGGGGLCVSAAGAGAEGRGQRRRCEGRGRAEGPGEGSAGAGPSPAASRPAGCGRGAP